MRSMTGFGRGEAKTLGLVVVVEMKTVNNRFRDVALKLPREYQAFEHRVSALLRDEIQRGRVEVTVRRIPGPGVSDLRVDLGVVEGLRRAAATIAAHLEQPPPTLEVQSLLGFPGVLLNTEGVTDPGEEWSVVESAVREALRHLGEMREVEGAALRADLEVHLAELAELRAGVIADSQGLAARLLVRVRERVRRLLDERGDDPRFVQEAAILADRADVSEELSRLGSHLDQFGAALSATEPVGRRLDFLLQEMNREVSTLGAKAAEDVVSARVVLLKTIIERLREQAANVE